MRRGALGVLVGLGLLAWWAWPEPPAAPSAQPAPVSTPWRPPAPAPVWAPDPADLVPELGAAGLTGPADLDPTGMVTCAVQPPLPASSVELLDDALPEIPEVARIADGLLVIPAPRPQGTGVLKVPGFLPLAFGWSEGRCLAEPLVLVRGGAAVVGRVLNAAGEPEGSATVAGCGGTARTDRDGSFYLEAVPDLPCEVQAMRADGGGLARSPAVALTPTANRDQVVDLILPAERLGGLGVVVEEEAGGLWVRAVVGPARGSGLRAGDRVLAVDGEPPEAGWADSPDLSPGEPGTEVMVRVQGEDGVERELRLVRGAL